MEEIFLTREETARFLKINVRQVDSLIKNGKLRAKDVSTGSGERKYWRVLKTDVLKLAGQ